MRRLVLLSIVLIIAALQAAAQTKTGYVDPFIGTDGMGHTFPGACVPFGGIQLSPDTDIVPHNIAGKYQQRNAMPTQIIDISINLSLLILIFLLFTSIYYIFSEHDVTCLICFFLRTKNPENNASGILISVL